MLKRAIDINQNNIPSWAANYLHYFGALTVFQCIQKNKRKQTFNIWFNSNNHPIASIYKIKEIGKTLYFNKKGEAVFYWDSASDKTAFILRWA